MQIFGACCRKRAFELKNLSEGNIPEWQKRCDEKSSRFAQHRDRKGAGPIPAMIGWELEAFSGDGQYSGFCAVDYTIVRGVRRELQFRDDR